MLELSLTAVAGRSLECEGALDKSDEPPDELPVRLPLAPCFGTRLGSDRRGLRPVGPGVSGQGTGISLAPQGAHAANHGAPIDAGAQLRGRAGTTSLTASSLGS